MIKPDGVQRGLVGEIIKRCAPTRRGSFPPGDPRIGSAAA
jgi:hypothetical protein